MKFSDKVTYNASAADYFKAFSNREFVEARHKGAGAISVNIISLEYEAGSHLNIEVEIETAFDAPIPGFAKKFLAETITSKQSERWELSSNTGKLVLDAPGVPGTITANMRIDDHGATCDNNLDWDLNIKIPLVGGKVEKIFAEEIKGKTPKDVDSVNAIIGQYI